MTYFAVVVPSHKTETCVIVAHRSHAKEAGLVLVLGQGDVGQLGQGEDVLQRKKPSLVPLPEKIVQVVAGGMHTVCLSDTGHVSDSLSFFSPTKIIVWQTIVFLSIAFCLVLGLHFWL